MNIIELRQKIEELTAEVRGLLDTNKVEEGKQKMEELRGLKDTLKLKIELEEEEKRELEGQKENKKEGRDNMDKIKEFRNALLGRIGEEEKRSVIDKTTGAAVIPQEFVAKIEDTRKGYVALKDLCDVIPVTSLQGKMPVDMGLDSGLEELQNGQPIGQATNTYTPILFDIKMKGKIVPIYTSVLESAGIDLIQKSIVPNFAEASVSDENKTIVTAVKPSSTIAMADHKTLIKEINKLAPNVRVNSVLLVNTDGYDYLDQLEDKNGRPLLSESLTMAGAYSFKGLNVVVVEETVLATVSKKVPFLLVNLKKSAKFFDYGYQIAHAENFESYTTKVRCLDLYDVKKGVDTAKLLEFTTV